MTQQAPIKRLSELASEQWGLLTRRQAEESGVSPATLQRLSNSEVLERAAWGVYHLVGAPEPEQMALRAAWLGLAPETPAWERGQEQGVVSHRSAAALYGLGHLPADRHVFTMPNRRQVRRKDVRVHRGKLTDAEWIVLRGLPVTCPSRIAADLLADHEDPEAVAHIIADAIRGAFDQPGTFAQELEPQASRLGFRRSDGIATLRWLLDLVGDPESPRWMKEARASFADSEASPSPEEAALPR